MAKISEVLGGAAAIAKGMSVTFREMLNPTLTEDYPEAPAKFQERYRGVHELQRDENGLEKCVACFLCSDLAGFTTGAAINMDGGASPVV